jgi:ApbE superfamily uncharacterized protein (UPF0280 family)
MKRFRYRIKQTIVTELLEEEKYFEIAVKAIQEARKEIESTIKREAFFLSSLEPF